MLDAACLEPVNLARMSSTFYLEEPLRTQTKNILQEENHVFVYPSTIRKYGK